MFAMAEEAVDEDALYRIIRRLMADEGLKNILAKLMQNATIKQRINLTLLAQREKK